MSRFARLLGLSMMLSVLGAGLCASVWALQRAIKTKVQNYPNTPVEIRRAETTLTETFATPTQSGSEPGVHRSRVRYANRGDLLASSYMLTGKAMCANRGGQLVEAFALTIVAFDAFHQPVQLPGRREGYLVHQVVSPLARGATREVGWEQPLSGGSAYEVAIVVTMVRFADGSMWVAPKEELIDIF